MMKYLLLFFAFSFSLFSQGQDTLGRLTIDKIMRDPKWIGTSPSSPQWTPDGKTLYFNWNPDKNVSDSLYFITINNAAPAKATLTQKQELVSAGSLTYNKTRTAFVYDKNGDIFFQPSANSSPIRITNTVANESNPVFSFGEQQVVYTSGQNLFAWHIKTGQTQQLTNVVSDSSQHDKKGNEQEEWLKKDQLDFFQVLKERSEKKKKEDAYNKSFRPKELRKISLAGKMLAGMNISPDGRFVAYRLFKPAAGKRTIVPDYVTSSGFTTDLPARTKVGEPSAGSELYIYDNVRDTVYTIKPDTIPGIRDIPKYYADYPKKMEEAKKKNGLRNVSFSLPSWSPASGVAVIEVRSQDYKDRWLVLWDTASRVLRLADRQTDEAWISGPGISMNNTGWIDDNTFWFQSEATGYSHLYLFNIKTNEKKALTSGNYEVQQAQLSNDKKYFYISTNEVHPGEKHFYRLTIADGKKEKITSMTGSNLVILSPDEKQLAILYSYSNKPTELYLLPNPFAVKTKSSARQITNQAASAAFLSYPWRDPELITFKAADGADVYARLYKPAKPHASGPAVIFVHGAGYLQNAHKWWSNYFREYMFHNLLADNGYTVMDIDYRGSAGYGRDWRTGIYRHMGGKDLSDQVDAANYMIKNLGVNPKNIGIYGGSYGGFITLMAMFTTPNIFKAGAALRPVTDWAQYNHGYTANILNEPFTDSIAYRRSSPLYFAEGLKGNLLICHGVVDVNVHFQDAVKLVQRLIELGKDNWELAMYPVEDHGFVEPSSWTDEYKRIFKLFETNLKSTN